MSADEVPRRMIYPYTLSAKIAQFPYKLYLTHKNTWLFRFFPLGILMTLPIFYKIQKLSYSPENVKKWEEVRREQFSGKVMHH
ncbi:reduction of Rh1 [Nomia melanderi]|uniref:reduction of Rh1 n=1 Tax=Nomia melanderi TaxID=2448451 RepID=UPI0013044AD8|nr:uncharacterized protein LOC116427435 [Nomia melanderi]